MPPDVKGGEPTVEETSRIPYEQLSEEPRAADATYPVGPQLTVGDGFRLGCGLILAFLGFLFVLVIGLGLLFVAAAALRIPIPLFPS